MSFFKTLFFLLACVAVSVQAWQYDTTAAPPEATTICDTEAPTQPPEATTQKPYPTKASTQKPYPTKASTQPPEASTQKPYPTKASTPPPEASTQKPYPTKASTQPPEASTQKPYPTKASTPPPEASTQKPYPTKASTQKPYPTPTTQRQHNPTEASTSGQPGATTPGQPGATTPNQPAATTPSSQQVCVCRCPSESLLEYILGSVLHVVLDGQPKCFKDSDCKFGTKCCQYGQRQFCIHPQCTQGPAPGGSTAPPSNATPNPNGKKNGYCPARSLLQYVVDAAQSLLAKCHKECQKDGDCAGDKKCCKYDCASFCVEPLQHKPTDLVGQIQDILFGAKPDQGLGYDVSGLLRDLLRGGGRGPLGRK